jgi:hypothetical protein
LSVGKYQEFVEKSCDERTNANLLNEFGVVWCLEDNTGRVKCDWTVAY